MKILTLKSNFEIFLLVRNFQFILQAYIIRPNLFSRNIDCKKLLLDVLKSYILPSKQRTQSFFKIVEGNGNEQVEINKKAEDGAKGGMKSNFYFDPETSVIALKIFY